MKEKNQDKLNSHVLKSGVWYTVSNILIKAVSIFTAPIFTRLLTTSDYGIASNFTSWMSVVLIFTGLCLTYSFGRAKIDFEDKFDEYVSSIQTLGSIVAISLFILSCFFSHELAELMNLDEMLVIIMFFYLIIYPSVDYAQAKYRYDFRYKENIVISLINTVGVVLFSFLFIYVFNNRRYVGRIIGTILPIFLMGIFYFFNILLQGKKFINLSYWRYALRISLPMIPHMLAMVVITQIDRIMIMKYDTSSGLGIYSFAYSYAVLLSVFSNAISQAWIPWLYKEINFRNNDRIKKVNESINCLMCILTILCISIAPEVLKVLGTKEYWDGKWLIAPIAIGVLCQYFYSNYANIEIYYKKTVIVAIGSVLTAIIVLVLNMLFIPRFGYFAAAYTSMIGFLFLTIFHCVGTRLITKKQIFNDINIFYNIVITSSISFGFMALYNYVLIRYGFILVFCILIIILKRADIDFLWKQYIKKRDRNEE